MEQPGVSGRFAPPRALQYPPVIFIFDAFSLFRPACFAVVGPSHPCNGDSCVFVCVCVCVCVCLCVRDVMIQKGIGYEYPDTVARPGIFFAPVLSLVTS